MGTGVRAVCAAAPSAPLPPRARLAGAASLAPPPWRVRVYTRAYARARRRARAAPGYLPLAHVWGARPSLPPFAPGHLRPASGAARRAAARGLRTTCSGPRTLSLDPSWDFRTPGPGVPRIRARQLATRLQLLLLLLRARRASDVHPSPLSPVSCPSAGWASPPSGVQPGPLLLRRSVTFGTWVSGGT